jgi:integrase/recombinase XerD
MEELIEAFRDDLRSAGKSDDTLKTYPYQVQAFSRFLGKSLLEVTKEDLRDYLDSMRKRNLSQSSIERYFVIISEFYKFLIYSEMYKSPNPISTEFWHRYILAFKGGIRGVRRCPTTSEMITLVNSILNTRNKALIVLLAKTGCRRRELCSLDRSDVDLERMTIQLKPTAKRTNRTVFIDDEAVYCISRYLNRRTDSNPALFLSKEGNRLALNPVDALFKKEVMLAGLYKGEAISQRFSPHCCRHWMTTELLENGMSVEHVQWLRGDKGSAAINRYHHINPESVKLEYERCIPKLNIL